MDILSFAFSIGFAVFGIVLLIYGAYLFIAGAKMLALAWKISPLIVGIVVVGFSTSAPELLVSVMAGLQGSLGLSVGNVVGSNITNIALALALPALLGTVIVRREIVLRELPLLIGATLFSLYIFWNGDFTRTEGMLSILLFTVILGISIYSARKEIPVVPIVVAGVEPVFSKKKSVISLLIGFVLLLVGAQLLVFGSTEMALALGVSELLIGLTIVAIGTSLPEIASSCVAVLRGDTELALGNVIGSNIFNLLAILGTVGILSPGDVGTTVIHRDGIIMLVFTCVLFLFCLGRNATITRMHATILLVAYFIYLAYLIVIELIPGFSLYRYIVQ